MILEKYKRIEKDIFISTEKMGIVEIIGMVF